MPPEIHKSFAELLEAQKPEAVVTIVVGQLKNLGAVAAELSDGTRATLESKEEIAELVDWLRKELEKASSVEE
ncbi:MAG: hypothetical protein ABIH35_00205 [Patescibacteria group bacterium]